MTEELHTYYCKDCFKKQEQIERLEQENKELSFAIEKCLENAGIECDDEEQALRSLPMLGNAHYKVLVEKEALEQENKDLKKQIESDKGLITVGGKQQYQYLQRIDELEQENKKLRYKIQEVVQTNDRIVAECAEIMKPKCVEVLNEKEL